jgi:hypothetical protein
MPSLNRVTLIGHLGADPEVRYTQNREAIATIRIATTEISKDKSSGERKETTEWHRVIFFNRTAEVVGEYLRKGLPDLRRRSHPDPQVAGQRRSGSLRRRDHRQRNADARRSSIGEGRQSIGFRPSSCQECSV